MSHAAAIANAREGTLDAADVQRLYDLYGPCVRSLLRRLVGDCAELDDLLHDVFLVAWRRRDALARQAALGFLYGTAVRLAAAARRRARLRRALRLQSLRPSADWETPEHLAEAGDAQRIVQDILDRMAEPRRTVFILNQVEGLSGEAIAEILSCSVNTVWTRLHRARQEFLTALEQVRLARVEEEPR